MVLVSYPVVINPRRVGVRVIVITCVCLFVCLSVCSTHISKSSTATMLILGMLDDSSTPVSKLRLTEAVVYAGLPQGSPSQVDPPSIVTHSK